MFTIEVYLPVRWPRGYQEGLYDLMVIAQLKILFFLYGKNSLGRCD
jgi:hypothetical protein